MFRLFFIFFLVVLSLGLGGCSTGSSAIVQTMQAAWGGGNDPSRMPLNPNYQYLRVVARGGIAVLALGDVDGDRANPVEVWYSAQKEVLRFQNGRLAGATGLTTEWRSVSLPPLPSWSEIAKTKELQWTRSRDVMPGYQFGIHDRLLLRRLETPPKSQLQDLSPSSLIWFEEVMLDSDSKDSLPPARYALELRAEGYVAVYGEQCLDSSFCFSWQRWSSRAGAQ